MHFEVGDIELSDLRSTLTATGSPHQQALPRPCSNPRTTAGPAAPKDRVPRASSGSATLAIMLHPLLTIRPLPSLAFSGLLMPTSVLLGQDSTTPYLPLISPTAEVGQVRDPS